MLLKVGILMLIGGGLPLFFADAVPQKFSAETRLSIDTASEAAVAKATAALRSKANLDNLVRALNLGTQGEFAVDRPSAVRIVSDIVSGEAMSVTQAEVRLRERLLQAITVVYDPQTRRVAIAATAEKAEDAASIANMLGDTFRDEIMTSGAGAASPVLEKLRQTLDRAEAALAGFMAQTDEHKLAEMRRTETATEQRAAEIGEREAELADLKRKAAQAAAMKLGDVLTRPLPDSLDYTGLDYQRQRHVEAKLAFDQLSGDLGPRHPRLLVAQAALEEVKRDIQEALKQLVNSLRQQESAAAKRLSELKALQTAVPADKEIAGSAARLNVLEAAVAEAREHYLEALNRSEAELKASAVKADIVAPATTAGARPLGPSALEIAGGGALVGACLGAALAFFTRRKLAKAVADDRDAEFAIEPATNAEPDWVGNDGRDFAGPHHSAYEDPAYDDHADYDDYDPPVHRRYPPPANDSPFADHIRDMLMANRRPEREAMPPLVAAVMAGRLADEPSYAQPRDPAQLRAETHRANELRQLRRSMAELRERVELYSASRSAGRR